MRFIPIAFTAALFALPLAPALAASPAAGAQPVRLDVAQNDTKANSTDEEEQIREDERRLRERKRALRDRQRDEREESHAHAVLPRAWLAVGAGLAGGTVEYPCNASSTTNDCSGSGTFGTYSANVTITGPYSAMRVRGVREQDRDGNQHVPYEEAAMIGSRFGHSDWYGMAGYGRFVHPDDKHPGDAHGFAWEIVFAPSTQAVTGIEVSFQGDLGADVDYFAVNIGMRFGALR